MFGLLIASALIAIPAAAKAPALSTIVAFDPTVGELPESIAADADGNLYVSMLAEVRKVSDAGVVSTLVSLPVPPNTSTTGVKFGPNGSLFVNTASFDPTLDVAGVWQVSPDTGDAELFASLEPGGFPNDLAFDAAGNAFVTDSFLGRIYKITPDGTTSVWLSDPALLGNPSAPVLVVHEFGANGIAFDKHDRNLYVANLDFGTILQIRVRPNGTPGPVEVFASDPLLLGADGIAFDKQGTLYVAVNAQDRIATVDKRGRVCVAVEGGALDSPSAFAFGVQHQDRRTLFITNFAIARALGIKPGTPNPAILGLRVQPGGLPLP
jgi:sugar lactone lactonase YvrE